jgi:hypothetical protein
MVLQDAVSRIQIKNYHQIVRIKYVRSWVKAPNTCYRHGIVRERASVARGRFVPNCGRICGIK